MYIHITNKIYNVQLAVTEQEKEQGLSNTESLPENSGMLFDYSENPQTELTFNTIDMNYPIDIVFINIEIVVKCIWTVANVNEFAFVFIGNAVNLGIVIPYNYKNYVRR